ncbi:hypothetical protein B4113_1680 [Geobacillus sp. B4113_201601]|nr:hypothetical protein B4113_1680 [Geobacillus sp. B4113_201601]
MENFVVSENVHCFYRTYEGLKLKSIFLDKSTPICFYRTYEGLKPVRRQRVVPPRSLFLSYL